MRRASHAVLWLVLSACGGAPSARGPVTARQALAQAPELLEETPAALRAAWRQELLRASQAEAGQPASSHSLFPLFLGEAALAAPALESRQDLLAPAALPALRLHLDMRPGLGWSDERRDALQGLSEREAAELVARALLSRWGIPASVPVQVERAAFAPYAAAYVDGVLRLNPAFVLLAAAPDAGS
ncbi:MAG: hypothetical protein RL653_1548 [Pseudomonadota bacterium]|jgi:hypothetical protein